MSQSQEVARQQSGAVNVVKQYSTTLTALLPDHRKGEAWLRLATGVLRDDKIREAAEADVAAFVGALSEAASLGLNPGTKQYYLIPQREKGKLKVRGQTGYQGEIELIYNAGAVSSVVVEVVYSNDGFQYQPGANDRPIHTVDWFADSRGELVLAYAYAVMKDGATSKVVIVNKARIKRAMDSSAGANSSYSPWTTDTAAMWLKTAVHDLTKFVPTSAELRNVTAARAEAERAHALANPPTQPAVPPAAAGGPTVQATVVQEPEGRVKVETGEVLDPEDYDPTQDPGWGAGQ